MAGVGALSLVLVPVVTQLGTSRSALERWLRARSVSEQLKTEIYHYLTRTGPYGESPPELVLIRRRDSLLEKVADLEPEIAGFIAERPRPAIKDVSTYITHRLDHQIKNYCERAGGRACWAGRACPRWERRATLA